MLLSIEGDVSTFKTTFALTSPVPIVGFMFDLGWERAVYGTKFKDLFDGVKIHKERFNPIKIDSNTIDQDYHNKLWSENDITIYELPKPLQLTSERVSGFIALWNYFIALFGMAVSSPVVSSIVCDTATIARTVKADAYVEELNQTAPADKQRKQLLQIEYGHPNTAIENLYSVAEITGKNFIATHHMRDQYVQQQVRGEMVTVPNGKLELEGWNKTHRAVDVAIETAKDKQGKRTAMFVKNGYNVALEGRNLIVPTWDGMVEQIEGSLEGRLTFPRRMS